MGNTNTACQSTWCFTGLVFGSDTTSRGGCRHVQARYTTPLPICPSTGVLLDLGDPRTVDFRHKAHPDPSQAPKLRFEHFPLGSAECQGPWLCTQGCGGGLTHFFPESYHVSTTTQYCTANAHHCNCTIPHYDYDLSVLRFKCFYHVEHAGCQEKCLFAGNRLAVR